jgi:hypothetical protein
MIVYYRIYTENGGIPSKRPVSADSPFLGQIKATSIPPPHTANSVKRSIARVEDIKDRARTILCLTPYSLLPMEDVDDIGILDPMGPGFSPEEPVAFVAKVTDLELGGSDRSGKTQRSIRSEGSTGPETQYCKSIYSIHFVA